MSEPTKIPTAEQTEKIHGKDKVRDYIRRARLRVYEFAHAIERNSSTVTSLMQSGLPDRQRDLLERIYVESEGAIRPDDFLCFEALDAEIEQRRLLADQLGVGFHDGEVRARARRAVADAHGGVAA